MNIFQTKLLEARDHLEAGRVPEASRLLDLMLSCEPDNPSVLYLRAAALQTQGGYNGIAIALLEKCLSRAPEYTQAWVNLGCAYREENNKDYARHCWEEAIRRGGETADLLCNMATLYADSGEPEKALEWIDKSLEKEPENPNTQWNRALALLTKRDWAEGWKAHEYRIGRKGHNARQLAGAPRWDGKKLAGTLCVTGEQGIGDEIMFASCIPDVLPLVDRLIIECTPRLVPVFGRSFGVPCFSNEQEVLEAGFKPDAQIPLGSLPHHFRNRGVDFPGTPYLKADPSRAARWADRMGEIGPRPWIGLSWQGGTKATRVHHRSLNPDLFKPLMGDFTCVSLQYGRGEHVVEDAKRIGLTHWPEAVGNDEYEETMALVSVLDAVVTVSTAIFHAAGSQGIPCHILVSTAPTWVHSDGGVFMPWYKAIQQWRQETLGEWVPVIEQVRQHLLQQYAPRVAAE